MENKNSIIVGAIAWQADREKFLEVTQLEDALNETITLINFGIGIEKIVFVPMGVPENDPIHKESVRFYTKTKKLEIYKRVPVDDLGKLSLSDFLQEIAQLFYREIIQALKKRKIKNFDAKAFIQTIEKTFIKKGWFIPEKIT